jgi:hypothetical protein
MSDPKSYGQVACEASLGDVWDSLTDVVKLRWEDAAQAVIKEYKLRSESDTKLLQPAETAVIRGFVYDEQALDWFPRVHADGDNYVEDSIS